MVPLPFVDLGDGSRHRDHAVAVDQQEESLVGVQLEAPPGGDQRHGRVRRGEIKRGKEIKKIERMRGKKGNERKGEEKKGKDLRST